VRSVVPEAQLPLFGIADIGELGEDEWIPPDMEPPGRESGIHYVVRMFGRGDAERIDRAERYLTALSRWDFLSESKRRPWRTSPVPDRCYAAAQSNVYGPDVQEIHRWLEDYFRQVDRL
jgi:hypothetical protein